MWKSVCFLIVVCRLHAADPFAGFQSQGLVGVARIPAAAFDQRGPALDTLGGTFSGMTFDPATLRITDDPPRGPLLTGELFALPDRGFGDGMADFRPRRHALFFEFRPDAPAQDRVNLRLISTQLLRDAQGAHFTGSDADPAHPSYPLSFSAGRKIGDHTTPASLGAGRRSLDPEGLVLLRDGTFWIADEYGPLLHHFSRDGVLLETFTPPHAFLPRKGPSFGSRLNDFGASVLSAESGAPDSGRMDNRGFEGLAVTPDEKRLVAALQSPLVQDSGSAEQRAVAVCTRLVFFDLEAGSVTRGRVVQEYVYPLHRTTAPGQPQTVLNELLALNDRQFLAIERDGFGHGQDAAERDRIAPRFKRVMLVDIADATNLAGTGYDLEKDAPGQRSLPADGPPPEVVPAMTRSFIDLLDPAELGRFGLNARSHAESDENTLSEKWEGLALVPFRDPARPDDALLLVGNDNDFKARNVFHNGELIAAHSYALDTLLLVYRVTLPGWRSNLGR